MNSEQTGFIRNNFDKMLTIDIASSIQVDRACVMKFIIESGIDNTTRKTSIVSRYDGEYIKNNYLINTSNDIGNRLGISGKQVRGWISNHIKEEREFKHRKFNSDYFRDIDCDEKAYYIGLIYADGWIYHSCQYNHSTYEFGIELQYSDKYLLEGLSDAIGGVHPIKTYEKDILILNNRNESHSTMSRLRVYSKDIVTDLYNNGIDFNKTKTGIFPIVDDKFFLPFLKGYIDGDGCIHKMKDNVLGVHITSCSSGVLEYINKMVSMILGFKTSIYSECKNKYRIYWFARDKVKCLLDTLYSIKTPELFRKRNVYEEFYGLSGQQ